MFGIIKKMFIILLINMVNGSNHTKCVLMSNQKCLIQTTLINLHPHEYSQEFPYYPFAVKLDRCVGSCNTLNDLSNNAYVPNKTENLNLTVFNMITGINESKTLTRHIACECKCRFDGRKCNSDQWWNNDKCQCECKKHHVCEKDYVWNPATNSCENEKNLASIIGDSAIVFDKVKESCDKDTEAEARSNDETNFNENKATCKTQIFYIFYFHFY